MKQTPCADTCANHSSWDSAVVYVIFLLSFTNKYYTFQMYSWSSRVLRVSWSWESCQVLSVQTSKILRKTAETTHCSSDLNIYLNTDILQDVVASENWQNSAVFIENRPLYTQQISGLMYKSKLGLAEGAGSLTRLTLATQTSYTGFPPLHNNYSFEVIH